MEQLRHSQTKGLENFDLGECSRERLFSRSPFARIPLHGEIFRMYLLARALRIPRILQFVVCARLVANGNDIWTFGLNVERFTSLFIEIVKKKRLQKSSLKLKILIFVDACSGAKYTNRFVQCNFFEMINLSPFCGYLINVITHRVENM